MSEGLLSADDALARVLAAVAGPTEHEVAHLSEALGRVIAEDVDSAIDLPPWDNSAMDGYAVRAADVSGATDGHPIRIDVTGEVRAGQAPDASVERGTAMRIATGAPVPRGADAVVPVELTTPIDASGEPTGPRGRDATGPLPAAILVHDPVSLGGSIRRAGSDLTSGTRLLAPGTVVDPASIALVAGVGVDWLTVHRRPIVGILATGDEVRAGQAPDASVERGTAMRIATGAPVPPGADAVVPVELTTPIDTSGEPTGPRGRDATGPLPAAILVHDPVSLGGSIRRAGSDLTSGTRLLAPGTVVDPASIALVAGVGIDRLTVHRRPIVGILATGDEVRAPGSALGAAGIPDANGPALAAMVAAAGGDPRSLGIASDRYDDVRARLCAGLVEGADAIIVSGGVSVGPYDVVRAAFESFGPIELWRVAVQPGKPFAFGTGRLSADDGGGGPEHPPTLLFGLPGNPVSTFVTFELFVRPAIRSLAGHGPADLLRPLDRAILAEPVSKSAGRRAFIRVTVERDDRGSPIRDDSGRLQAHLAGGQGGQGSHVLSALAAADGLAVVPEATDTLPAGADVELWWLDRG